MKLSFTETVYMTVVWILRHILPSNYDNIKKTKYDIESYEDYLIAGKIATMTSACKPDFPEVDKYQIMSFGDIADICNEVVRYERINKIYWLTMGDKVGIRGWRDHNFYGNTVSLYRRLRFAILMEFC